MATSSRARQHQDRHDEVFVGLTQQTSATSVVGVGGVEGREQRSVSSTSAIYDVDGDRLARGDPRRRGRRSISRRQGGGGARCESPRLLVDRLSMIVESETPRRRASAWSVSSEVRLAATVVRRTSPTTGS